MQQEIKLMEENAAPLFRPLGLCFPKRKWLGKRKEEPGFRMHLARALFKVYPNPAHDYITLRYRTAEKYNRIWFVIQDASGKILMQQSLNSNDNEELINISDLSAGNYTFILYGDAKRIEVKKIAIVK